MERVGIQVKSLCYGSEEIEMLLNGERIGFHASYMGQEPLASLVQAVYELEECGVSDIDNDEVRYESEVGWLSEPGFLSMGFKRIDDTLHIHLKTADEFECKAIMMEELRFCVSFKAFKDAVIRESMRVLREYGFKGYYESWGDHRDFPLATFLTLMGIGSECKDDDSIKSCFEDECRMIMELTKKKNNYGTSH